MDKILLGKIEFDEDTYQALINDYSESFTHTSLDIEKEFVKLEKYTLKLKSLLNYNNDLYRKLSEEEKMTAKKKFKYFITYMAYYKGMIPKFDINDEKTIDKIYDEHFKEFDKYMIRLLVFDKDGKVNLNETGRKVSQFFPNYMERKPVLEKAQNSKRNHINAFYYALNKENIYINEIIKINEIINLDNPNAEKGFKKSNNEITGSTIQTTDKKNVYDQIRSLIDEYINNNMGVEIEDPNEDNIDEEEEYKRLYNICLREAKFHIKFEHIHPFADGNGRTGRIIMSTNLIKQNVTPPLLTKVMLKEYKEYINDYNYEGLAQMILESSSQLLSTWVTIQRNNEGISPDKIIEAKTL